MTEHRALVTGAGHRIGRAISVALAKRGFDVAIHFASSSAGAEETAAMVRAVGQRAEILKANLVDMTEAEALLPQAIDALGGPLTLLVNNASIFEYDTLDTATQASWDRHINSNLRAPVF
ncbi:MAG: SDR family NAD(P)-dependent oxidoreductase, partial [Pseudomonadota bacterium]